jgi:hypothetical protein
MVVPVITAQGLPKGLGRAVVAIRPDGTGLIEEGIARRHLLVAAFGDGFVRLLEVEPARGVLRTGDDDPLDPRLSGGFKDVVGPLDVGGQIRGPRTVDAGVRREMDDGVLPLARLQHRREIREVPHAGGDPRRALQVK